MSSVVHMLRDAQNYSHGTSVSSDSMTSILHISCHSFESVQFIDIFSLIVPRSHPWTIFHNNSGHVVLFANALYSPATEEPHCVGETEAHSIMGHILSAGFSQKLSSVGALLLCKIYYLSLFCMVW